MPITVALQNAISVTAADVRNPLGVALDNIAHYDLIHVLSARTSFMDGALADGELTSFAGDIRRVRAAETGADILCGEYADFPTAAAGNMQLRILLFSARRLYAVETAAAVAVAPPLPPGTPVAGTEDPFKPLPPAEIASTWDAGEAVSNGYTWLPPKFRISDSIISRMSRANKEGELWFPPIGEGFSYRDSASTRMITTLLKSSGEAPGTDVQVQMVQGSQSSERHDSVYLVSDYTDIITHRSAAIIACYCTPKASADYCKSTKFALISKHQLVTGSSSPALFVLPRMVAKLEQALRSAARAGFTTGEMLAIDANFINAILERSSSVKTDGNLAIEHVCEQRLDLLVPGMRSGQSCAAIRALSDVGSLGPSASRAGSEVRGSPTKRERELQSELDKLKNNKRNERSGDKGKGGDRGGKVTYGGTSRHLGGGDPKGKQVCRSFNEAAGCYRSSCNYEHVCNKEGRDGRMCGQSGHCAIHH